ncbi:glycosyltransferase [Cryobacterium breve]|uniref:glycosyltransferase n=1 Tax=Cryobacterium breve TaxID=1259258 RepID=UPI00248C1E70|nr:glycosyltransferase [Cryobacterium breve]
MNKSLPLRFVLLGNGSQRESNFKAEGSGIERLQFIDSLGDLAFQETLAAADVLLINEKHGVSEMAVPSKLTSYFNAGKPVLAATAREGVTAGEITAARAGVVVSAEDPTALVDAALRLAEDPQRAAQFGANGMRYRTDVLGEEVAIDRFAQWLRSLTLTTDHKCGAVQTVGQEGGIS